MRAVGGRRCDLLGLEQLWSDGRARNRDLGPSRCGSGDRPHLCAVGGREGDLLGPEQLWPSDRCARIHLDIQTSRRDGRGRLHMLAVLGRRRDLLGRKRLRPDCLAAFPACRLGRLAAVPSGWPYCAFTQRHPFPAPSTALAHRYPHTGWCVHEHRARGARDAVSGGLLHVRPVGNRWDGMLGQ